MGHYFWKIVKQTALRGAGRLLLMRISDVVALFDEYEHVLASPCTDIAQQLKFLEQLSDPAILRSDEPSILGCGLKRKRFVDRVHHKHLVT